MAGRGVWFALTDQEANQLLGASTDDELISILQEEIEDRWDEDWLCEADKAWDAIHRCLTDGTLSFERTSPLAGFVLGGSQLHAGGDYIISYSNSTEVKETAAAVASVTKPWFRERYFSLAHYDGPQNEEDFEYSWAYFDEARELFQKAAKANRAIVFTVDQ